MAGVFLTSTGFRPHVGVGEHGQRLPVRAKCAVPSITVAAEQLWYGDGFLRYPYTQNITMSNDSGKYAVLSLHCIYRGLIHSL